MTLAGDGRAAICIGDSPAWLLALVARGGDGYVEIRYGRPGFDRQHFMPAERVAGDPEAAYRYTQRLAERFDVCIGATVRIEKTSGTADNVGRANALWADLDDGRDILDAFPLAPNLVCETSPGRFQAWWALPEPFELVDDDARREFVDKLKRLQRAVGSDNVADLARILRVPGTLRWKDCHAPDDDPNMIVPVEFRPEGVCV